MSPAATHPPTGPDTNPYRGLLPDLPAFACTNCGHWQRWPAPGPQVCPVCADVRNALPEHGFEFVTPKQADELVTGFWRPTAVAGITEFGTEPRFGLDSRGWVIETDAGLVGFECAPWYTHAMLAELRRMAAGKGGLDVLASSHVHGYGALWQLQLELEPRTVCVGVRDLEWTKAFRVTWPADDVLELAPDLVLHRTGGHFPGHSVLHDSRRGVLFCGDSLKVDLDADGNPVGLSAHKAFHAQIPLSHGELREYLAVVAELEFGAVATPFELVPGVTTDHVVHLVQRLLSGRPDAAPIALAEL
ncbi:MBL fold metallo-hydrolase [Modestobacter excelsi]|uniref:MBL fold metallo-hydrolase n=1 Tax=Modestobacter excelsi TaxID=2213161 RepID=UPI001C20EE4C|nr:MBL fold metallo-hydrolase [Modestobacter excelsi]